MVLVVSINILPTSYNNIRHDRKKSFLILDLPQYWSDFINDVQEVTGIVNDAIKKVGAD